LAFFLRIDTQSNFNLELRSYEFVSPQRRQQERWKREVSNKSNSVSVPTSVCEIKFSTVLSSILNILIWVIFIAPTLRNRLTEDSPTCPPYPRSVTTLHCSPFQWNHHSIDRYVYFSFRMIKLEERSFLSEDSGRILYWMSSKIGKRFISVMFPLEFYLSSYQNFILVPQRSSIC